MKYNNYFYHINSKQHSPNIYDMIQYTILPVTAKYEIKIIDDVNKLYPKYSDLILVLNEYGQQGYYLVGNPIRTYIDSPMAGYITYDYIAYQIVEGS